MSGPVAVAAILTAWAAAALLFVCLHGARRTARLHQRPRRRPTPPPGHPESIPTVPDPKFDRIAGVLWKDRAFRELICPRPNSLVRYPNAAAARADLAKLPETERDELVVRQCVCLAWHIRIRPGAYR